MSIPAGVRRQVIQRAGNRCEYCGLSQAAQEAVFHVDHIIPVTAGGKATLGNLALACVSSSLRKGARLQARPHTVSRKRAAILKELHETPSAGIIHPNHSTCLMLIYPWVWEDGRSDCSGAPVRPP